MIDETSYASDVADELSLTSSAYGSDAADIVNVGNVYGEELATAINSRPVGTLRVMQYNVGHFNMGMASGAESYIGKGSGVAATYPQFFDYSTQLLRWQSRINAVRADLIGMPEWNDYFGYSGGNKVPIGNAGIFDAYNVSAGKQTANYWWQHCLASKFAMTNIEDIDLEHLEGAEVPYVRVATINIDGKTVKIAVTHLNWKRSQLFYDSRQVEIKSLVKLFDADPYVILCGDFNTDGHFGSDDYLAGLEEYEPFVDGFTENGVTYQGGFTLANSTERQLLTYMATGSRPDQPTKPQYPYCYLDNVITKGFEMSNVQVVDDGNLTDHCGIMCDLTLID